MTSLYTNNVICSGLIYFAIFWTTCNYSIISLYRPYQSHPLFASNGECTALFLIKNCYYVPLDLSILSVFSLLYHLLSCRAERTGAADTTRLPPWHGSRIVQAAQQETHPSPPPPKFGPDRSLEFAHVFCCKFRKKKERNKSKVERHSIRCYKSPRVGQVTVEINVFSRNILKLSISMYPLQVGTT